MNASCSGPVPVATASWYRLLFSFRWLWRLLIVVGMARGGPVWGQTVTEDGFNGYSSASDMVAAGWRLSALNPALVTTTFPAAGEGRALRLRANPVPGTAPAVGMWYRTNEYTDFYVALDLVDWPGTDKNQAVVLFGHLTDATTGTVHPNINPATAQGVICNYDTSQYGEGPTDRRQGQFQINVVNAGFNTRTLAVAEVTLEPGRSYRMTFRSKSNRYTAELYDYHDLTRPLVVLEAEDFSFYSGACGFLGFSRQGTEGTVDLTVDNYYCGPDHPHANEVPVMVHPVAGTPQVVARNPTNRFTHFHPAVEGIRFTVSTFSDTAIDVSATRLYLNGQDVSGALQPLPANASTVTLATAPGTLAPNRVYAARIEVQDVSGTRRSTNTFWFDTFQESLLEAPPFKTIECEDYNYESGRFQTDPVPPSGYTPDGTLVNGSGVGYYDLVGTPNVDYFDTRTSPEGGWNDYRTWDAVGTSSGNQDLSDLTHFLRDPLPAGLIRSKYTRLGLQEYVVARTEPGEWLNYTRMFVPTNYHVYLRVGSFGATEAELGRVTSDPTRPDQTVVSLGRFYISNHLMRIHQTYVPLMRDGQPAVVALAGQETLRLTMGGVPGQDARKVYLNYLLFVPVAALPEPVRLEVSREGSDVVLTWPEGPWRLEGTPALGTAPWTEIVEGIVQEGNLRRHRVSPTGARFYRLVAP
ncbi:hypothetical protein G4L39_07725 [Limisphaera ngatamarikiensis]|uniref:Uncharacterized protein n=1 Tax=Limisphaera ngatamarikiensis TaxID=1324935 RepID=A0A6M1RI02_9BACT|nr:hypothetical protein [Limisphaera ngatamarikiensis]NGO39286.1 hypothetical protein [Limisphaera ngatamarikiensis]